MPNLGTLEIPQMPQPPQELPEPAHPRRKSKNFEESLEIFRSLEQPPKLPPPPSRSRRPRPSPSPSRTATSSPTTSWTAQTKPQVESHSPHKKITNSVANRAEPQLFSTRQPAICSDQHPRPPPTLNEVQDKNISPAPPGNSQSQHSRQSSSVENSNSGGNSPLSQSDCRTKTVMASKTSDW